MKAFLQRKEQVWTDGNHPDIAANDAAAWVRSQWDENSDRQKQLEEKLEMMDA